MRVVQPLRPGGAVGNSDPPAPGLTPRSPGGRPVAIASSVVPAQKSLRFTRGFALRHLWPLLDVTDRVRR